MTDDTLDFFDDKDDKPAVAKAPKRPLTQRAYFPWLVVLGILVILLAIFSPIVIVRAGHQGVATFFGEVQGDLYAPGVHMKYPLLRIHQFATLEQKLTMTVEGESQDLQLVNIEVAVNYHLETHELQDMYAEVGEDFIATRLEPVVKAAVGETMADFTAEELVTDREDFKTSLVAALDNELVDSAFVVDRVVVTEVTFSKALQEAYTAEAAAEKELVAAELERRAAVVKAETATLLSADETERIRVIGEALRGKHPCRSRPSVQHKTTNENPVTSVTGFSV
jgi:regulator of protease activity HflC (stomatin/prohibitin superfamily)